MSHANGYCLQGKPTQADSLFHVLFSASRRVAKDIIIQSSEHNGSSERHMVEQAH